MRKRTEKMRGSRTHGRGKKAGRGAGKRGGRGNAGLHKHKYITTVKFHPDYFGRPPLKRHPSLVTHKVIINIGQLDEFLPKFVEEGKAEKKGDKFEVNLTDQGVDKLLGAGSIKSPVKVTVDEATPRAIEKVEKAGGEVVILEDGEELETVQADPEDEEEPVEAGSPEDSENES